MNKKMTKSQIFWSILFLIYIIGSLAHMNNVVYQELEKDYELKRDMPFKVFDLVSFAPFNEQFIRYRFQQYNETWVILQDNHKLVQRVG